MTTPRGANSATGSGGSTKHSCHGESSRRRLRYALGLTSVTESFISMEEVAGPAGTEEIITMFEIASGALPRAALQGVAAAPWSAGT